MFHPEVVHTPQGGKLLGNFVHHVAGCAGGWTMQAFRQQAIAQIRRQVGEIALVVPPAARLDLRADFVLREDDVRVGGRLFEGVDAGRVALEPVRAEPTQRVTHLTYAVRER